MNPGPRHTQPAKPGYLQVSLVEWPQSPATSESLARHHGRQTVYYGSDTHPEGDDYPPRTALSLDKPNAMVYDPSCTSTNAVPGDLRNLTGSGPCREAIYPDVLHLAGSQFHSCGGPGSTSLDTQQSAGVCSHPGVEHKVPTPTSREWHILTALARLEGWSSGPVR